MQMIPNDRVFICINQEYYISNRSRVVNQVGSRRKVFLVTGFQRQDIFQLDIGTGAFKNSTYLFLVQMLNVQVIYFLGKWKIFHFLDKLWRILHVEVDKFVYFGLFS